MIQIKEALWMIDIYTISIKLAEFGNNTMDSKLSIVCS